ncbi:MAG: hypothetical protein ACRDV4_12395, partial [Acidimicrobiales bacterium]
GYPTLQRLSSSQNALLVRYDRAPYTNEAGSIPFIDIANRYVMVGAGYDPAVLSHLSLHQIAGDLSNTRSPVARAIDGEANLLIAAISSATGVGPSA